MQRNHTKFATFLAWAPAIVWAGIIYFLSSQSALPHVGPNFPGADKLNHFAAYTLLAGFLLLPLWRAHRLPLPKTVMLVIIIASVYGITDEVHQAFVPHRTCDLWDWVADTLGGVFAASLLVAYETIRSTKTNC